MAFDRAFKIRHRQIAAILTAQQVRFQAVVDRRLGFEFTGLEVRLLRFVMAPQLGRQLGAFAPGPGVLGIKLQGLGKIREGFGVAAIVAQEVAEIAVGDRVVRILVACPGQQFVGFFAPPKMTAGVSQFVQYPHRAGGALMRPLIMFTCFGKLARAPGECPQLRMRPRIFRIEVERGGAQRGRTFNIGFGEGLRQLDMRPRGRRLGIDDVLVMPDGGLAVAIFEFELRQMTTRPMILGRGQQRFVIAQTRRIEVTQGALSLGQFRQRPMAGRIDLQRLQQALTRGWGLTQLTQARAKTRQHAGFQITVIELSISHQPSQLTAGLVIASLIKIQVGQLVIDALFDDLRTQRPLTGRGRLKIFTAHQKKMAKTLKRRRALVAALQLIQQRPRLIQLARALKRTNPPKRRPQIRRHAVQQIAITISRIAETPLAHQFFGLMSKAVFRLIKSRHILKAYGQSAVAKSHQPRLGSKKPLKVMTRKARAGARRSRGKRARAR